MPETIDREEVLRYERSGVLIVDVLPETEHEETRLAGSIGIWLGILDADAVARFDKSEPLIVYCHDPL